MQDLSLEPGPAGHWGHREELSGSPPSRSFWLAMAEGNKGKAAQPLSVVSTPLRGEKDVQGPQGSKQGPGRLPRRKNVQLS